MMSVGDPPLRTAVAVVAYIGARHAEKFARLPGSELVAVVDGRDGRRVLETALLIDDRLALRPA